MGSWINQIYLFNRIVAGHIDHKELDWLSIEEKHDLTEELLKKAKTPGDEISLQAISNIINCVIYLIPRMNEEERFANLRSVLDIIDQADLALGRAGYQILDADLVRVLPYVDRMALARILADQLTGPDALKREAALWGLVRVTPHLRDIHHKEFANEIFLMHSDAILRTQVLDALSALIFQLGREQRTDTAYFFAEVFKRNEDATAKHFTIELLKRVTSSVLQKDRGQIADAVAPLLFHTDHELAKEAAEYFAVVMGFLQPNERFHYADMVGSLINDLALHDTIVHSLEQMLPYLSNEHEKASIRQYFAGSQQVPEVATQDHIEAERYLQVVYAS